MPYIINKNTLALIQQEKKTKIIEKEGHLTVGDSLFSIIASNCILNGSTLEGRQRGSAALLGTKYKPPIVINNEQNIILIPTHSTRNKNCIWFNLSEIIYYKRNNKNGTIVELSNHQKININISPYVFDRQVLRATRLETAIRARKYQNFL